MQQYLDLLKTIKKKGVLKPAARENMPGTISRFGYQFRHDLADGFPLLTTKKVSFKNVVVELLWFLRGDTNIKFLVDRNCNIWNEDAYNFYLKTHREIIDSLPMNDPFILLCKEPISFEEFVDYIKNNPLADLKTFEKFTNYSYGDCGYQYGRVWRDWRRIEIASHYSDFGQEVIDRNSKIDQIKNILNSLKNNPESRRHIVTAIDPAHDTDLALYWCHCMMQFNCRPIPWEEKLQLAMRNPSVEMENLAITEAASGNKNFGNVPQYYLDCQLYQRSADSLLGVPYNIASYALLIHILAKLCNMIPGDFIHTFGDVHIYENHMEAVDEQLLREPRPLPKLNINTEFWETESGECGIGDLSIDGFLSALQRDSFISCLIEEDIQLYAYNPHPKLTSNTELSTGLKKK